MSNGRNVAPGTTRTCPHCRAVILDSASMCPSCKRYLRFDPGAASRAAPSFSPLKVEGTIRHPADGDPWEYSVVLTIRNERGEEIARHVVGVGAMHPGDERAFTLTVDVYTAGGAPKPTGGTIARGTVAPSGRSGATR
jgi:hypothetical protein